MDYAGPKFEVVDRSTGEVCDAMVFVGVLGASELHVRGRDLEPRAAGLGDVPTSGRSSSGAGYRNS